METTKNNDTRSDNMNTTTATTADKVLVGLSHGADEPENVLIAYLMGVEALRAGNEAVMWLTKDGIEVAVDGFADTIDIDGAPNEDVQEILLDLHAPHEFRSPRHAAILAARAARHRSR
jgi:hypothetical protein